MKIALVTGGNRGIGKEVCKLLAKENIIVFLTGRNPNKVIQATEEINNDNVKGITLDVTSEVSINHAINYIIDKHKKIDILVNNAGIFLDNEIQGGFPSILETKTDNLDLTLKTNVIGPLNLIKKVLPYMKNNNYGRIVNVSSGMGSMSKMKAYENDVRRDIKTGPHYRISKVALNVITRIVAEEVKEYNILVNSVCPGWVSTNMGGKNANLTPFEAAIYIIWAIKLSDRDNSGKFYRNGEILEW